MRRFLWLRRVEAGLMGYEVRKEVGPVTQVTAKLGQSWALALGVEGASQAEKYLGGSQHRP